MTTSGKRKWKIYQEEAKLRQTTHWDLDYMTDAELEALYNAPKTEHHDPQPAVPAALLSGRRWLLIGLVVSLLLTGGLLLLGLGGP